jgi:hypothetical protein
MANVYESDNFNIVSVFEKEVTQDGTTSKLFLLKVQRLPSDQFPDLTDVYLFPDDISTDISKADFLAAAPALVTNELNRFDNEYTGASSILETTDSLIQKFTE